MPYTTSQDLEIPDMEDISKAPGFPCAKIRYISKKRIMRIPMHVLKAMLNDLPKMDDNRYGDGDELRVPLLDAIPKGGRQVKEGTFQSLIFKKDEEFGEWILIDVR